MIDFFWTPPDVESEEIARIESKKPRRLLKNTRNHFHGFSFAFNIWGVRHAREAGMAPRNVAFARGAVARTHVERKGDGSARRLRFIEPLQLLFEVGRAELRL